MESEIKFLNLFKILNKTEKITFLIILFFSSFSIFIELLSISSIPIFFSSLLDFKTENNLIDSVINWISINTENNFMFIITSIVIIFLIKSLILYFIKVYEIIVYKRIRLRLSELLLNNYLSLNLSDIQKDTPATRIWKVDIINNLVSVIDNTINLFRNFGYIFIIFIFFIYFAGSEILYLFLGLLTFASLFYIFFSRLIKKSGALSDLGRKDRANTIHNIMNGIKDIFILNKFNFFKEKFKFHNIEYEKNLQKNLIINNLPVYFLEFVGVFFISLYAVKLHLAGTSSEMALSLISVLAYGGLRLIGILKITMVHINNYKKNSFIINLILSELVKKDHRNKNNVIYQDSKNLENLVEIKNLSFGYQNKNLLFNKVNLELKKNKIYALIGKSGIGKSTLLDLLLGIYESNKNTIKINCSRQSVGYVPQESYLIQGTVKENIALGVEEKDIDLDKINACMKKAKIYEFINSLPKKLDSNLNIFGSNISVGQKQRIGIARALYFDPKILLLDEPTSSLDYQTEKEFIEILEEIKVSRLILMTTHKKNFLEKFDHIFELENQSISDVS